MSVIQRRLFKNQRQTKQEINRELFFAFCRSFGIPEPTPEWRFALPRRWALDYAWIPHKVCLEIEGGLYVRGRHVRPEGFLRDIQKYNRLALNGWLLLRCIPKDLTSPGIYLQIKEALDGRSDSPP
jgi:hypothetical protein